VVDAARIFAAEQNGLLWSIAVSLVLPYSLFRWGAGREAVIGLGVLLTWLAVTNVADPTGAAQVVGAFGFFSFSAALGASIRYHANARIRDIEQAKLRQRKPARARAARHGRPLRLGYTPHCHAVGGAANGGGSLGGVRCGRSRGPTWRPRRGFGRRASA